MKFTLAWLKDHLETDASLDEIVDMLTMIGLEVEAVENKAAQLAPFTIARVVSAEQHPDADRLRVCMVDTGSGDPVQVVCGAPNARTGLVGVFAAPGVHIPGTDMDLKIGTIRGVESRGMLCSERELMMSDNHDGIIDLPEDAPVGTVYATWAGLDDPMIEIGITPNRPDCLGVYGIARDLAAAGLGDLKENTPEIISGTFDSPVEIDLRFSPETADACSAFYGRYVRGVTNGPSPAWMQQRLLAIGLRPINALVDITNYVSYDRGRPLHVYDADKLQGVIHSRMGKSGESYLALDGKTYNVEPSDCVIADDRAVLGFGGIMGGEETGSSPETKNVLIECAYFDPLRTAETGRRTGINSDARYRFERGVDPAFVGPGAEHATKLVMELCGGEPSHLIKAGQPPEPELILDFPIAEVKRLSGLDVPPVEMKVILSRLGFWVSGSGDILKVAVPTWRPDVHGKEDLVEEVVRIVGVDKIAPTPLEAHGAVGVKILTPIQIRTRRAKRALAARGMVEAVTWSFVSTKEAEAFGGGQAELKLANPLTEDMSDMRPSLLPGLLAAAQRNLDRGFSDLALFEVGQVYAGDAPEDQTTQAAGIRRGTAKIDGSGRHWAGNAGPVDAFDAKADAATVLDTLGAPVGNAQATRDAPGWYHPGRSGVLRLGPNVLATFGEIHPGLLEKLDIDGPIVGFEITLETLPEPRAKPTKAKAVLDASHLQPVRRDFAFLVDASVEAQALVRAAKGADKALISDISVFDLYEGKGIEPGKKSLAIEVMLQPKEKTLTDAEIDTVGAKVVEKVTKATGGVLRG